VAWKSLEDTSTSTFLLNHAFPDHRKAISGDSTMRVDATTLPQAARENSRASQNVSKPFPGIPAEKANEIATTNRPTTENIAAKANAAEKPAKPESEKLTPAGLLAAQLRFESMNVEEMNKGQSRAMEVINRNLARYQANEPAPVPVAEPATPVINAPAEPISQADENVAVDDQINV
jgi:hypothetical protein